VPPPAPTQTTPPAPQAKVSGVIHGAYWRYNASHVVEVDLTSASPSVVGEAPRPTGTVVLFDRGVRLGEVELEAGGGPGNSRATWTGQLAPGYAHLTATYSGDSNYAPHELPAATGRVQNLQFGIFALGEVKSGQPYRIAVSVSPLLFLPGVTGSPTGTVTLSPGLGTESQTLPMDARGFVDATFIAPTVETATEVQFSIHYSGDDVFVDWTEVISFSIVPTS
jgi:hypothetical protein